MIGISLQQHLVIQSWSGCMQIIDGPILSNNTWLHVGYTYSPENGMQLYIDGRFYASTRPFTYDGHNGPNTVI